MPSALAASTSTSSTPIVYFATTRSRGEIVRNARSMWPRNVAPSNASTPTASAASCGAIRVRGRDDDVAARRFEEPVRGTALVDRPVDEDAAAGSTDFAGGAAGYWSSALTAL